MRTADYGESNDLYRISGWKGAYWFWSYKQHADGSSGYHIAGEHDAPFSTSTIPAYDADYLLAMLPACVLTKSGNETFDARWQDYSTPSKIIASQSRTNPANALCRLAIALFEEGILIHDGKRGLLGGPVILDDQ